MYLKRLTEFRKQTMCREVFQGVHMCGDGNLRQLWQSCFSQTQSTGRVGISCLCKLQLWNFVWYLCSTRTFLILKNSFASQGELGAVLVTFHVGYIEMLQPRYKSPRTLLWCYICPYFLTKYSSQFPWLSNQCLSWILSSWEKLISEQGVHFFTVEKVN